MTSGDPALAGKVALVTGARLAHDCRAPAGLAVAHALPNPTQGVLGAPLREPLARHAGARCRRGRPLNDLAAAGIHFESFVARDLRIYSQTLDATPSSWRDSQTDVEIDVVLELPNGRWAAFEIKLGEAAADAAAASLLHLRTKSTPSGTVSRWLSSSSPGGRFTCTRADGLTVALHSPVPASPPAQGAFGIRAAL